MDVTSICPLVVAAIAWQPRPGLHALTVVAKATFELQPGRSTLAEQQEAIAEYDNHWNDDPSCSLHVSSDLVPFKPLADVLVIGQAYSPKKEPVTRLTARLAVAGIDKCIDIRADRIQLPDGTVREGAPFVKMPLRYERAGYSATNPVGVRHEQRTDRGGIPLPNLQAQGTSEKLTEPAGFGPIAPAWIPRVSKAPRPVEHFVAHWFKQSMPDGFDPSFFNSAPKSQQVETLHPDERIVLEALHPEYPSLETVLPGIVPHASIERAGSIESMRMAADTLLIDAERGICTLTWRGQTRLARPDEPGEVIISMVEPPGFEWKKRVSDTVRLHDVLRPNAAASEPGQQAPDVTTPRFEQTLLPITRGNAPLPFSSNQAKSAADVPPARASQSGHGARGAEGDSKPQTFNPSLDPKRGETLFLRGNVSGPEVLPFEKANQPEIAPPVAPAPAAVRPPPIIELPPVAAPPALTIGQVVTSAAAAQPLSPTPNKQETPPFLASGVSVSSPAENVANPKLNIGSVAALREAGHLPNADPRSAAGFSNAAAQPEFRVVPLDSPAPVITATRQSTPVEVLWFDETALESIRKAPRLASILEAQRALQHANAKQARKERTKSSATTSPPNEGKTDIASILSSADPSGPEGLNEALRSAVDERGTFTPPLVFMGGTLEFPFDEQETLKATIAAITPMAVGDKKLNDLLATIGGLMRTSWLHGTASERLTKELKDAFAASNRQVPTSNVETHVERILLEQRHYQKRVLLGQTFLRALLVPPHTNVRLPAYIPQQLARELPMFQRFAARVIVEARPQLDQYEASPTALRVVALGRVVTGLSPV